MSHDCTEDVIAHRHRVTYWLQRIAKWLTDRAEVHDNSKLMEPEKSIFDEYTWRLQHTEFGSDEYQKQLDGMGEGLAHHYRNNRHHPEHFTNGVDGMNLLDLTEMICDWIAAAERKGVRVDLDYLKDRFSLDDQLTQIISNTLDGFNASSKWTAL